MRPKLILVVICGLATRPAVAVGNDPHLAQNPVYRQLIETGVEADGEAYRLPLPALGGASDAATQQEVIAEVVPEHLRPRFFRDSVVAPHVVKLESQERTDGSRFRIAHFWFAAKANLSEIVEDDFLDSMTTQERDEEAGQGQVLTAEQLQARGIELANPDPDNLQENYGHGQMRLLKKVDIAVTSRSFWTKHENSAVAAMVLDPRFADDQEFPNSWRKLTRNEAGTLQLGEPHAYAGSGGYVKISQLHQPEGFVMVEGHLAFVEPQAWFGGANLLGSKLPALIQTEVRAVRKALLKAAARRGE
jgi:hypothetical protein